jgi:hypothetical protein
MGYKVIETENKFRVIEKRPETKEEVVIREFSDKDTAKTLSRSLNLGAGFDGWTPNFFLNSIKIPQS